MAHFPRSYGGYLARDDPIDYTYQRLHTPAAPPVAHIPSEIERMASLLERDNAALRQELKTSRDKASDILKELSHSREETRNAQLRCEELQHEVQRCKDASARVEGLKIAEAQAETALLKQELRSRDSHIAAQQEQIRAESERSRSVNEHAEQQRREIEDLRAKLQATSDKFEGILTQAGRRDELVKLLESDIGHKQQRLEQSERLVSTLQNQNGEKDLQIQKWQAEAEGRARTLSDMETQLRKLDASRTELDQRGDKTRAALQELCDLLGTAFVDTTHGLRPTPHATGPAAKLREILAAESRLRQEVAEARQAAELRQYELQTRGLASDQVKAEATRLHEALRAKDGEINALREELLSRTRELRSLTLAHTGAERDERARHDQLLQFQSTLQQKDQMLADRDKAAREQAARDQAALLEARNESLRASTEHSRTLSTLQARIGELEQQLRADGDYVEACRRIGHVLCVDPTTSSAMYAQSLVQAVERLGREGEARAQRDNAALASNARTAADSEWLKTQLMESEQRFVKTQVRHDALTHDLARLLGLADSKDTDAIVAEVAKLKHKRAPVPPPTPGHRARPGTAKDKEDTHKQLLDTIAQQDRWIATLQSREPAVRELQTLREETARLRALAGDRGTGAGEWEARLQRHIDFRSALLRTLKMSTASATDDTILRRVEQLMVEASKPSFAGTHSSLVGPSSLFRDALALPPYGGDNLRLAHSYNFD